MAEERRANPNPFDIAGALAVLYTLGYLLMVGMLFVVRIPEENEKPLLQLFGLMSAIQMALIGFYFGSSKNAEAIQRSTEQRSARTESKLQEVIVKAVPMAAASGNGAAQGAGALPKESPVPVEIVGGPGIVAPLKVQEEPSPKGATPS